MKMIVTKLHYLQKIKSDPMPGDCSKFSTYKDKLDCNGDIVSSWAELGKSGHFRCRVCSSNELRFNRGMTSFNQHAMGRQHKDNFKKTENFKKQISIADAFNKGKAESESDFELRQKVQNFEIDFIRTSDFHNVVPEAIPCLIDCIKRHLGGDDAKEIASKVSISTTKCRYVQVEGIAKTYIDETVKKLRNCDGFCIGFDESEVNHIQELEVMVILADEGGIELRHYRTLALDSATADAIFNTIVEQLEEDKIDWKGKLISPMTDGCPTMQGRVNGVKKKFSDHAPQVLDFGSCNDHHIGNAARHACSEIRISDDYGAMYEVFIDILYDIGGAPGKGMKRQKEFERLAKEKGRKLKSFHQYGGTRFKGYPTCIEPILFNWDSLVDYYSRVTKPSDRAKKLKSVFVDKEFETLMKLYFVMSATRDLMEAIAYFEERENKIHLARQKMEKVLHMQLLKFVKRDKVEDIDEDGKIEMKAGKDLLSIDPNDDKIMLSNNLVFIGESCGDLIKKFGLTPSSPQLEDFFKMVFQFHRTVASKLIGYFSIGLRSTELEYMEGLSPHNRRNPKTRDQILYLATSFSKIMKNIRPIDGFDKLRSEIDMYQTDIEVGKIDKKKSFNDYWLEVAKIEEGQGWKVFEVLPKLALVLGTPFNSGAEMERGFSVQSDIHRDSKRNQMKHKTLDAHLQIRYGVESKETREKCQHCSGASSSSCPCHCRVAPITEDMRTNVASAWRLWKESRKASSLQNEVEEHPNQPSAEFNTRLEKFKESLSKRSSLYKEKTKKPNPTRSDALEDRQKRNREEANNNSSKISKESKRRKKVPLRHTKDIDSDTIVDKT